MGVHLFPILNTSSHLFPYPISQVIPVHQPWLSCFMHWTWTGDLFHIWLEGMMLKLKLQYFGHLMRRVDSLEKTLILGGVGDRRRRGQQRMRWIDGITDLMDVSLSEFRVLVMDREAWRAVIHGVAKSRTWLSDWTELNWLRPTVLPRGTAFEDAHGKPRPHLVSQNPPLGKTSLQRSLGNQTPRHLTLEDR